MADNLPGMREPVGDLTQDIGSASALPPSLQILLNEGLYTRMKQLGMLMANAEGFTPKHLLGKGEACFAVINCALDWKINPHFVARHTYQTPSGQIGFDGALTQAILEKSGRFIGPPEFQFRGDWSKLIGKFERRTGQRGGEYYAATWTDKDAVGLGVIVKWQVRGEAKPRVWPGESEPFWLTQCHPRNSTLWATDPKTQICYLAIRRFASIAAPGIAGAAGFDAADTLSAAEMARDITPPPPRPTREQFTAAAAVADDVVYEQATEAPIVAFDVARPDGEVVAYDDPEDAAMALLDLLRDARGDRRALAALREDNDALCLALVDCGRSDLVDEIDAACDIRNINPADRPAPAKAAEQNAPGGHAEKSVAKPNSDKPLCDGAEGDHGAGPHIAKAADDPEDAGNVGGHPAPQQEPADIKRRAFQPAPIPITKEPAPIEMPHAFKRQAAFQEAAAQQAGAIASNTPAAGAIEPPLRNGKPDYRTWRIVLFDAAMRKCATVEDLATLIGDNYEHIENHDRQLPDQAAAFKARRDAIMARLDQGNG